MTFSKEFKEALSHLPNKEKDRLLFRLLKKDKILAKRLEFELVSSSTVEDQRDKMEQRVEGKVKLFSERFYSLGYLNMDIRYLSGEITEHVKVTKDKFGEVSLNLLLMKEVLKHNNQNIINTGSSRQFSKLGVALIARVYRILILIEKLDQDYFIEFENHLKDLGLLIGDNSRLMKMCIFSGLDVNWLIQGNIPEDISQRYKYARAEGYLSARNY
jgi:hypothetical protein